MLRPFYLIMLGIVGLNCLSVQSSSAGPTPSAGTGEDAEAQEFVGLPIEGPGLWHTEYKRARDKASAERKMSLFTSMTKR